MSKSRVRSNLVALAGAGVISLTGGCTALDHAIEDMYMLPIRTLSRIGPSQEEREEALERERIKEEELRQKDRVSAQEAYPQLFEKPIPQEPKIEEGVGFVRAVIGERKLLEVTITEIKGAYSQNEFTTNDRITIHLINNLNERGKNLGFELYRGGNRIHSLTGFGNLTTSELSKNYINRQSGDIRGEYVVQPVYGYIDLQKCLRPFKFTIK